MKKFKFEERIPAVVVQYYEVEAETEEEALAMVQDGKGFQESYTETMDDDSEFELFDLDDI